MEQLKVGEITLIWLGGGTNHPDAGAMFGVVPKPLWSRKYNGNDENQIELRNDPILVQYRGRHLLIDAGLGNGKFNDKLKRNHGVTEESQIDQSLAELGLTTADIDTVMMTHMHYDHANGLSKKKGDQWIPTFENAEIHVTDIEWDEMRNPNIRSKNTYWEVNWRPIQEKVCPFHNQIEVMPGIHMIHTGGHSAGHAIVTMEQKGEKIIHMADIMPTHAHESVLWVSAFDDYPMDSIVQKQKWMTEGRESDAWYIFYHDTYYRAVKWGKKKGKIKWEMKRKGAPLPPFNPERASSWKIESIGAHLGNDNCQ